MDKHLDFAKKLTIIFNREVSRAEAKVVGVQISFGGIFYPKPLNRKVREAFEEVYSNVQTR